MRIPQKKKLELSEAQIAKLKQFNDASDAERDKMQSEATVQIDPRTFMPMWIHDGVALPIEPMMDSQAQNGTVDI